MNLIIDVGNTRVKVAVFEETSLIDHVVFSENEWVEKVTEIMNMHSIKRGIIAATGNYTKEQFQQLTSFVPFIQLDGLTAVPFKNLYKTPKTLGVDRIALIANAVMRYEKKNVLIIDAGTCITYDFINSQREYLGGAISPGIAMRYQALHSFTSKLPLFKIEKLKNYIGDSTENSIHSGVINGVLQEINGVITQYEKDYEDLTIVLTGGDTNFLAKQLKSGIFANPNFVLEGLNAILIYNEEEC